MSNPDYLSFRLPDDFIEEYVNRRPEWGFPVGGDNYLSELVYVNKYSALKDDGSKEEWYETVRRCIEGMYSILKDHCKKNKTSWNEGKSLAGAKNAYDRMWHFKWMPPGRGVQHMGRPSIHERQDSSFLQNCFAGTEEFVTRSGPQSFQDTLGQELAVWTSNGWQPGFIQSFGVQEVQRVTFKPNGIRSLALCDVIVTPNHRWILDNGTVTTDLKVGDVVKQAVVPGGEYMEEYHEGMLHGLIFGDGWKTSYQYSDGRFGYELRCCDARTQELASSPQLKSLWDEVYKDRPSSNGDWFFFLKSHDELKEFPIGKSNDYLRGFTNGWIGADAWIAPEGSYKLDSQRHDAYEWLKRNAASAGYQLVGYCQDHAATNLGERKAPLNRFTLRDYKNTIPWRVVSILPMAETEVYCAVVPNTASFTLASGIYTGNCAFLTTAKLSSHSAWEATGPFVRMMEMSMCGIGVGFDTRGAENLTLHAPTDDKCYSHVVEDSREGWAEAIGVLLESYFFKNRSQVEFDYSQIRPSGAPLKSFGGQASGPQPLIDCVEVIQSLLDDRKGDKITSTDIVNIMNLIGKAVVAGGARRSAQIAFGDPEDDVYTSLKDWTLLENKDRCDLDNGWAWNSNNSVFVDGEISEALINKTIMNGEPGYMWLDLAQQYGRMVDPRNDKDYRAMGGNPCLEQTLEPWECCTLVETFPTKHVDFADYRETLKAAYLYGKAVTLLPTAWPETNEIMARNRRIGCSMSGLAEFVETRSWSKLQDWMDEGYQFIHHRDQKYSEWLAVRESIKMTSIKPSGTVSLVASVTPGVHWPVSAGSHIRRVRYSVNDPLVARLIDAGYPCEPMKGDPKNTVVVTFVTQSAPVRDELNVSIWEKAELAVMAQRWWADNQVSATVTFTKAEEDQIAPLLASKKGQLKGISFLPLDQKVYEQAPYEHISEKDATTFTHMVTNLGDLYSNGQDAIGDKFCDSDVCTI